MTSTWTRGRSGRTQTRGLTRLLAGAALAVGLGAGGPVQAKELVLSSWLPPQHPIVVNAIQPWAEDVAEATDGEVTVRVLSKPLGPAPAHYDLARDGVADITYGLHSFVQDERFVRSRIGQFSFLGDDAVETSRAFWDVYAGRLDAQKEHEGTHLLGLFMHGPGVFHNNVRRIEKVTDFQGLKIRTPGGYIADLMRNLGATALFMSSNEVYEKLSRGVIDGVTFTYEALTAFNLTDDIDFSMRTPGGIYNTTWFLVMNDDTWASLSEENRKAIQEVSGAAFAELVGKAWNEADEKAIAKLKEAGIEIYDAPEPVLAEIKDEAAKLEADWAEKLEGQGYDGAAALEAFRERTGVDY
jgi:TRAP-type C4-dicarboxylate transport system substrate-binding protein